MCRISGSLLEMLNSMSCLDTLETADSGGDCWSIHLEGGGTEPWVYVLSYVWEDYHGWDSHVEREFQSVKRLVAYITQVLPGGLRWENVGDIYERVR